MDVELDDFDEGRPMRLNTNEETGSQIKKLKAAKQYKELLDLAKTMPNTKDKYLVQAHACLHLKKWKELSDACDRGLDLADERDSSDFLNLKGRAVGKLGNFEEKVKLTARAIQIDDKVPAYHRNLGAAYYKLKEYEKAVESHERAIALEPKNGINYHNKGAANFRLKRYEQAQACFEKATQLDKKQSISYAWLGNTFKEIGQYQKAKENYLIAYQISDNDEYKKSAREMEDKLHPDRKKGFFARIFG